MNSSASSPHVLRGAALLRLIYPRPPRHRGFTLVELLVVIGIIAVLISILLPALSAAREQSRRAVCSANLHNWGVACFNFAAEKKGVFPTALRTNNGAYFPSGLNFDDQNRAGGNTVEGWRTYGVALDQMYTYGLQRGTMPNVPPVGTFLSLEPAGVTLSSLVCPSSTSDLHLWNPGDSNWGDVAWGHYMYVGGITKEKALNPAVCNWGTAIPAVRQNDPQLTTRVLAMDEIWYSGGASYAWDYADRYRINHRQKNDPKRPAFQNILYGDGHVLGIDGSAYPDPLSPTNFSFQHYDNGAFFYWR